MGADLIAYIDIDQNAIQLIAKTARRLENGETDHDAVWEEYAKVKRLDTGEVYISHGYSEELDFYEPHSSIRITQLERDPRLNNERFLSHLAEKNHIAISNSLLHGFFVCTDQCAIQTADDLESLFGTEFKEVVLWLRTTAQYCSRYTVER